MIDVIFVMNMTGVTHIAYSTIFKGHIAACGGDMALCFRRRTIFFAFFLRKAILYDLKNQRNHRNQINHSSDKKANR
ncbi:MAG: hypothetical protein IPJ40_03305 [Saprospirales bacterium]|nr:hypothetical protein [Saprospirales bacterium]